MSNENAPAQRDRALSPSMWRVLITVGILVVIAIAVAIWSLTASARDDAAAGVPSPTTTTTQGPLPNATPTEGSEVLPPSDSNAGRLPTVAPPAPLITPPLPESASGESELVAGFPATIMGPVSGAGVVQNAIAVEGSTMQVSLVARTNESAEDVSRHYAELWASLGLAPLSAEDDGSLSYAGAFETLSLAFTPGSGTGTVFMIYGVFRTS